MDKKRKEPAGEYPLQMLTLILGEHQCQKLALLTKEKDIRAEVIVPGKGTVKSAALHFLGIKSQKKEVVKILLAKEKAKEALEYFTKELHLDKPGHGIAYITPVLTAGQSIGGTQRASNTAQGMEGESMFKKLTVVVNLGMAKDVMEIARRSGVTGGTILHGRAAGEAFTEKLFSMEIEPEKELVMMLVPDEIVDTLVKDLYQELQLDIPENGFLFVEPILEVRGLFDLRPSSGAE